MECFSSLRGTMANSGNDFTSAVERVDKLDVFRVLGEIDHWAVSARVEDSIIVIRINLRETLGIRELSSNNVIAEEARALLIREVLRAQVDVDSIRLV